MTLLEDIIEIDFWGVYERGIPSKERVIFKPRVPLRLTKYALVLGMQEPGNLIRPLFDSVYFFPDVVIEPPAWVFVFTCRGIPTMSTEAITKEPLHALYWGRDVTAFDEPRITAAIMRIDGILLAPPEKKSLTAADQRELAGISKTIESK